MTPDEHTRIHDLFAQHRHALYRFAPLDETVIQSACGLIERHPLRGYDAVHLATAMVINQRLADAGEGELLFLSADNHLNDAATAEGLTVDNPNDHS